MGNLQKAFGLEDQKIAPAFDAAWRWYVARTEPGREKDVAAMLRGRKQYGTITDRRIEVPGSTQAYYSVRACRVVSADAAPIELWVPEFPVRRLAGRKMRLTKAVLIPGHVLVKCEHPMPDAVFHRVKATPGVQERKPFLGNAHPMPADPKGIEEIRRAECRYNERPPADFKPGDQVFVTMKATRYAAELFPGIIEDVARLVSHGEVKAAIQMFARWCPVDVDISQVRAA